MVDFNSQFIPADFPLRYQLNGINLVAFIQMYYEWMEQTGNIMYLQNNANDYANINKTLNQFISLFQYELMNSFPPTIVNNKKLLIKHILDFYRAKGTPRGFNLLFKILFNEDISLYLPAVDIFKFSDNEWIQPKYIEVSDSPYLKNLVGNIIYSLHSKATALVESFDTIITNNKVVNVLSISHINGVFLYNDIILSNDITFNISKAPYIIGSLSSVSIKNGGINFYIGQLLNINGSGSGGLARVASTTTKSGKINFVLNYGGYGFTTNAVVQVIGGGGSGATFSVGSLSNEMTYNIPLDIIDTYKALALDNSTSGFTLTVNSVNGTFTGSEIINAYASNTAPVDFTYISGLISAEEVLSNTTLGISGLTVVSIDNPNLLYVTGNQANLNSLISHIPILNSSVSSSVIQVNSVYPIQQNSANGSISASNSTSLTIINSNGFFFPTEKIIGLSSGANCVVHKVTRNTNWGLPANTITNLDTSLNSLFTFESLIIGSIASLKDQNPGDGYIGPPSVKVEESAILQLGISDGVGGIWGNDAIITPVTGYANGIVTALQIVDSGIGFEPDEPLLLSSSNNSSIITGTAVVATQGQSPGYWTSNKSFASDTQHFIDSYYYQDFSYEISAPMQLNTYNDVVEKLCGPAGYLLFGKFRTVDILNTPFGFNIQNNNTAISYDSLSQST